MLFIHFKMAHQIRKLESFTDNIYAGCNRNHNKAISQLISIGRYDCHTTLLLESRHECRTLAPSHRGENVKNAAMIIGILALITPRHALLIVCAHFKHLASTGSLIRQHNGPCYHKFFNLFIVTLFFLIGLILRT